LLALVSTCFLSFHYDHRGETVCGNDLRVRLNVLEERVLAAIEETALTPAAVDYFLNRAVEMMREEQTKIPEKRVQIEKEIKRIRHELTQFTDIIASGTMRWTSEVLLAEIKGREERIAALEAELASFRSPGTKPSFDAKAVRKALRGRLADFRGLLRGDVQAGVRRCESR